MSALTPRHNWVPLGSCNGSVRISVQRWLPSIRRRQYLMWKEVPPQNEAAAIRAAVSWSSAAVRLTTGELRGATFSLGVGPCTGYGRVSSRVMLRIAAGIAAAPDDAEVRVATSAPIQVERAKNAAHTTARSRISPW